MRFGKTMTVQGRFEGKTVGRKTAKMWNSSLHSVRFECPFCEAKCGSDDELMSHFKKRHPKHYDNVMKRRQVHTQTVQQLAAEVAA